MNNEFYLKQNVKLFVTIGVNYVEKTFCSGGEKLNFVMLNGLISDSCKFWHVTISVYIR